jgi:drug/metabolite transporter (DMT)-like permease
MNNSTAALVLGKSEWSMLLLLALIWGSSFFFIGFSLKEIAPLTLSALRIAIAATILWLVLFARGQGATVSLEKWRTFALMGLLNNAIPFTLIIWAQLHIASGLAAILVATTPMFGVALAGWFLPDERITWLKTGGCLAGLAGVMLIIGNEVLHSFGDNVTALVACLLGAASFAAASTYGRRFGAAGVSPIVSATGQVSASAFVLVPLALMIDQPWTGNIVTLETWLAVAALGVVSTAFAYILYFRILASAGSTNILLVNLLVPIPAIGFGVFLLGESLRADHFFGLALIAAGLSAVDGRLWRNAFAH